MNPDQSPRPTRNRPLLASRTGLLASAAAIAILAFTAGAMTFPQSPPAPVAQMAMTAAPAGASLTPASTVALPGQPGGFADLVARIKPAVVSVSVRIPGPAPVADSGGLPNPFAPFGAPQGQGGGEVLGEGSGFFISADGYAVTNNHVVDHASEVAVTTDDGKVYEARVIGTDPGTDLAVIKVDGGGDFTHVAFADQAPRVGDWVVAVGNPFGLGNTVTAGIVSALGRDVGGNTYDRFMQIDAPINRGNSGGPTFDLNGNVVGINSMIFSPSGGSVGIGFDIPAETARPIATALIESGHISRGWLGVSIQDVTPDIAASLGLGQAQGALIAGIENSGPAASGKIKVGDVITAVNGAAIADGRALAQNIGAMAPGSSVELAVLRKSQERTVTLTLGEMPDLTARPPA